ncbi:peptide ABC transporter substrate-binding protein [Arthrobacter sp. MYb227]|uniref:ABC transporter substrate-binding protein n=1 Tax=Arthrobacter sp. MYb227 TaxID=1848601 RepID=UPI000CFB6A9C|nr:ABC transporter substrate-binding protein [Arthrobacter sp. MYb227]PQZ94800.1 peptide ABC transporter substrate-binding protein [Arthrobacter sp. MYb227]
MKSKKFVLGLALTSALLLTACSGGSNAQAPGSSAGAGAEGTTGGTMRVMATEYSHLDPAMGFDTSVMNFYRLMYRTLTTNSSEEGKVGEMKPDLATDLGTSTDGGKTWKFTLKDGIFFEDGTPITSAEVKFGVSRSFDPEIGIGSPWAKQLLDDGSGYQGPYIDKDKDFKAIETPDAKTIIFHLNKPFADFGSVVGQSTFVPFPLGTGAGKSFDAKPIASGPYKLDSYTRGGDLKLVRNDKWDAKTDTVRPAKPDSFEFLFGLDGATVDERMLAGQGDDKNAFSVTALQPANVSRLQDPSVKDRAVRAEPACTTYLAMNTTKKPLDNLKVRQAINYAIDKSSLQTGGGGSQLATVANTMMVSSLLGWNDFNAYPTPDNKGDIEKAKSLLAEAGYPDGLELTLDTRTTTKVKAYSESIQQSLAKAGIKVNLNVIDVSSFYEVIGTTSQQNDMAITGYCPDWASGQTFLPPILHGDSIVPKGNQNVAQLNDPIINKRMDEIAAMTDVAAANKAWGELDEQIMKAQAPMVPMVYENVLQLHGSNVDPGVIGFNASADLVTLSLIDPTK